MVQRERNRLQRFLTLRRLQLALPHSNAMLTHFCQSALLLLVTLFVPADLCHPKISIRLWNLAALRTLDVIFRLTSYIRHHLVSMPEASIHEDARPVFPQHQVWMPRQSLMIQPISESSTPQPTTHNHLRLRVLRPDGRHIFMTLLFCESVNHIASPIEFDNEEVPHL